MPLFPQNINNFIYLFCGGANVAINVHTNGYNYCIDNQKEVIRLFNTLKKSTEKEVLQTIKDIIYSYKLSDSRKSVYSKYECDSTSDHATSNKEHYLKLREDDHNQ